MHIEKVIIENFRTLKKVNLDLNDHLNIIVADNESGKSTILEAINLCLCGQINGRSIHNEINPFLFNWTIANKYIEELQRGEKVQPPRILIELYLNDDASFAQHKGTNNTLKKNCPGIVLAIEYDEAFNNEFAEYIKKPELIRSLPVEYYSVTWRSFASENVTSRGISLKPKLIDATAIKHNAGANKYILDILKDYLGAEQRAQLSISYRKIKDTFSQDETVKKINNDLLAKKDTITTRKLSISLDSSSRSNWENGIDTHLDEIPLSLVGKGEQNSIKIKLAMESSENSHIFLIEEPENHLSHSNLNKLVSSISLRSEKKQLIITTHSSFVLNKLGIENVILFGKDHKGITLKSLSPDTKDYFLKLPGHETLRLILSRKTILVEGPSDELIVQKAYLQKYKVMPLENGVDVITVNSLAFKRFLEITKLLNIPTVVVTDNDGNTDKIKEKYADYTGVENIKICFDKDITVKTLEPQLIKANGLACLNGILGKTFTKDQDLEDFMISNKTDCALSIFNSKEEFKVPDYISEAINE